MTACSAGGCSNKPADGFILHRFPSEPHLREQWISFLRKTRIWNHDPSRSSCLCSAHFKEDDYEHPCSVGVEMGFLSKKRLKKGAVPQIFTVNNAKLLEQEKRMSQGKKLSTHKRARKVVLPTVVDAQNQDLGTFSDGSDTEQEFRNATKIVRKAKLKTTSIGIQCDFPETDSQSWFYLDEEYEAGNVIKIGAEGAPSCIPISAGTFS